MALTDENKGKVLYHLNYPANSIVEGTMDYHSIIDDRLSNLPAFGETNLLAVLTKMDAIETKIEEAQSCLKIKSVDGVTFNMDHIDNLRAEYRRLQKKLSSIVDIPAKRSGGRICL